MTAFWISLLMSFIVSISVQFQGDTAKIRRDLYKKVEIQFVNLTITQFDNNVFYKRL
jgi:hypothetical protein